jgi:hypothetical protein
LFCAIGAKQKLKDKAQRIKHRDGIGSADKLFRNAESGIAAFIKLYSLCFMLYALKSLHSSPHSHLKIYI